METAGTPGSVLGPPASRPAELAHILSLLHSGRRCVIITGPGGIGKSTLARDVVDHFRAERPDVQIAAPELMGDAVTGTSALVEETRFAASEHDEDGRPPHAPAPRLVLLDGAEQLADPGAAIEQLLGSAPDVVVLATSRTASGHPMEVVVPVAGLDTSLDGAGVDLFLQLAAEGRIHVADTDLATVQAIVARLGGSPLGIRLCVGLARTTPIDVIHAQLQRGAGASGIGLAALNAALDDTVRWSVERLSEPSAWLLRLLSVFTGWATLDSIEGVAAELDRITGRGAGSPAQTLWLAELEEACLVESDETGFASGSIRRFRVPDRVREIALQAEGPPPAALEEAHRAWYLAAAASLASDLGTRREFSALERLQADIAGVQSALVATLALDPASTLRTASSLGEFWVSRGRSHAGARLLRDALVALGEDDADLASAPTEIALGLSWLQHLMVRAGAPIAARRYLGSLSVRLERVHADPVREEFVLAGHLVFVAVSVHELRQAEEAAARFRALALAVGDDYHAGTFSFWLARISGLAGRIDAALAHIDQATRHARRLQIESFEARCRSQEILLTRDRLSPAELVAALRPLPDIHLRLGGYKDAALISVPLALALFLADDAYEALGVLRRTLALSHRIHFFDAELYCAVIITFADLGEGSAREDVERCARLYGGVRPHLARFRALVEAEYAVMVDAAIAGLTTMLGQERLEQLAGAPPTPWSALVSEVDAFAAEQQARLATPRPGPTIDVAAVAATLSERERELLSLLLTGMTDKQIAAHLALRPNTVRAYNSRIFRKFSVSSRSELFALHLPRE